MADKQAYIITMKKMTADYHMHFNFINFAFLTISL